MRIQDIMTRPVIQVPREATVAEARERLRGGEIHHLVVMDGKRVAGVIAAVDLSGADDDDRVTTVMSHPPVTIEPQATLRRAAGILRGRAIGCLPVVDGGVLAGIVTTTDFLTALARGEIHATPPRERAVGRRPRSRTETH